MKYCDFVGFLIIAEVNPVSIFTVLDGVAVITEVHPAIILLLMVVMQVDLIWTPTGLSGSVPGRDPYLRCQDIFKYELGWPQVSKPFLSSSNYLSLSL